MRNAFVTLWSLERCRWLQRTGDGGPLEVIFGGDHQSLPSLRSVAPGDVVYPVAVRDGALCVLGRLGIDELCAPEDYVRKRLGFTVPPTPMWDQLFSRVKVEHPDYGHRFPTTCCDLAAVGSSGSELRFDRAIPPQALGHIRLGPKSGREQILKGVKEGRLTHNYSLQGHVRRLSDESVQHLEALF